MTKKTPNWQEHDNDILAQFPDSPAPELMALRQEPDWALRMQILSIPQDEQETRKRFQWLFDSRLVNRLAGTAVLALLVIVLGFWVFSISTTNVPATTQPESAAPLSTLRPTGTPTRDLSNFLTNIETVTPTAADGIIMPGSYAKVTGTDGNRVRLRSTPGKYGRFLAAVTEGERVLVIDGPLQVDEFLWWQIRLDDGMEGWLADDFIIPTAQEEESCPITTPRVDDPPDVPGADSLGVGDYFINENRTIWAHLAPGGWKTSGEKVLWIKPAGSELTITGRLLNQEYDIPLDVAMPCCYDGGFQVTSLIFFLPGCWEVTAEAGEEKLQFVTEVTASEGTVLAGLTLLEYKLSSTTPAANESFTVTLNWQARGPDTEEMLVFLQLIDSNGNIIVQDDEPMLPGVFTNPLITTTHSLEIPEQTGSFTLRLILAHEETFTGIAFWYNDEPVYTGILTLDSLEITAE